MLVEEKAPFVIETGDSVKVKQVLDDATIMAITEGGYEANYSWENMKLLLMLLSCVFAMVAQFFPMSFPDSRPLLAVCCAGYFIISTLLQYFVTFVDKDTILFTKPNEVRITTYQFLTYRILVLIFTKYSILYTGNKLLTIFLLYRGLHMKWKFVQVFHVFKNILL